MKVQLFSEVTKEEILACYEASIEAGVNYDCENLGSGGGSFSVTELLSGIWDIVASPTDLGELFIAVFFWGLSWPIWVGLLWLPFLGLHRLYLRIFRRYPGFVLRAVSYLGRSFFPNSDYSKERRSLKT